MDNFKGFCNTFLKVLSKGYDRIWQWIDYEMKWEIVFSVYLFNQQPTSIARNIISLQSGVKSHHIEFLEWKNIESAAMVSSGRCKHATKKHLCWGNWHSCTRKYQGRHPFLQGIFQNGGGSKWGINFLWGVLPETWISICEIGWDHLQSFGQCGLSPALLWPGSSKALKFDLNREYSRAINWRISVLQRSEAGI